MRIAFTGAHGTGKTTLCEELRPKLSATVSREVPRVIADTVNDDEFFRRGNNSPLRQLLIFFYQATEDRFLGDGGAVILHDRTMIDHLAYTSVLFPDFAKTVEFLALSAAARRWLGQYDLIFKVPIEFPPVDDGVREADTNFQAAIDAEIDRLYLESTIEPIRVSGSIAERVQFILDHLAKRG